MNTLRGIRGRASALALFFLACHGIATAAAREEPIQPVPQTLNQDPARAALGRRLFNDTRLSGNGRASCASCHDLAKGGADGLARSRGANGQPTSRNAPTVLNAALNFRQFWNGAADTLESQVDRVVQSPVEMGAKWPDVLSVLSADADYRREFRKSYDDGITRANVQNAIATYERNLITPNARFDRYLRGEADAISDEEKNGYAKFKQYGCAVCHQGVNVGGNMFQKLGVVGDYFKKRGHQENGDLGRYLVTGEERDKYVFKVPGLRNVAKTAPYFHDGSVQTLREAVDIMFRFQIGRNAPAADRMAIVQFLNSLSAEPLAP